MTGLCSVSQISFLKVIFNHFLFVSLATPFGKLVRQCRHVDMSTCQHISDISSVTPEIDQFEIYKVFITQSQSQSGSLYLHHHVILIVKRVPACRALIGISLHPINYNENERIPPVTTVL